MCSRNSWFFSFRHYEGSFSRLRNQGLSDSLRPHKIARINQTSIRRCNVFRISVVSQEHMERKSLSFFSLSQAGLFVQRSSKTGRYSRVSSTLPNIPVYTSPTRRDGCLLSKSAADAIAMWLYLNETDIFYHKDSNL